MEQLMRNVSSELRNKIKTLYYDQHHKRLEYAIEKCLSKNGKALIIDCHSYPDIPPVRDLQRELPRPDFCIGTDDFHTPKNIADHAYEFIASHGLEVKFNNPYAGTMIPLKFFKKDVMVAGIMIEVNRKLYMKSEHNLVVRNSDFQNIKSLIKCMITNFSHMY